MLNIAYENIIDNLPDAVMVLDTEDRIVAGNLRLATLLHADVDTVLGKTAGEVLPAHGIFLHRYLGKRETRTLLERDGSVLEVKVTGLKDRDGIRAGRIIVLRDLTDHERARASLKARLEQLNVLRQVDEEVNGSLKIENVLVAALDAAMRLSRAHAGYIAVLQGEEMRITYWLGKYPPQLTNGPVRYDDGVAGRVLVNQAPEFIRDVTTDPNYKAYIPRTESMMVLPLVSQERLVGMITLETARAATFDDETFEFAQLLANRIAVAVDNARLYEYVTHQLNETQHLYQQVSHLQQMKTDMIRIATHDLKAPLNILMGYVEMLKLDSKLFDPMYAEYFTSMDKAGERMNRIIADILSFERIEQRASGDNFAIVNLSKLIRLAAEELEPYSQSKNQTVTLDVQNDPPVFVRGDDAQLFEAATNLISNAIKYTAETGQIVVGLQRDPVEKVVRFKVVDNGYGIPEDRQPRLFEPFYRAKAAGTEAIEGTGLGLHLVKNVIERHNGAMFFESIYGKGSTFGFNLPLLTQS
jgi:PAS domain S-box-containing protein